ncbi:MAG TPA: hypothetical protein EYN03_07515 [Planctomycetes bacterium]|nr:hypothetical protein [Planctomycetota bacterium]
MSLFENSAYRWRETYFVLFESESRPSVELLEQALNQLETSYQVKEIRDNDQGYVESLTLISPADFAAMDVTYLSGEEIPLQVDELKQDLDIGALTDEEQEKAARLDACDARFEVFHFEQMAEIDEDDEFLDPGALLNVLECLAQLCDGVVVDPQSGGFI